MTKTDNTVVPSFCRNSNGIHASQALIKMVKCVAVKLETFTPVIILCVKLRVILYFLVWFH